MATSPALYRAEPGPHAFAVVESLVLEDAARGKALEVRVTYPTGLEAPCPVIVFSHGALGSKEGYGPLARHWASHGYAVIQPTHEDSREFVKPLRDGMKVVWSKWSTRPPDVALILDSLDAIAAKLPELGAGLDARRVGVGGHSFGAHTSMLIGGVRPRSLSSSEPRQDLSDERARAVLLLSPQGRGQLFDEQSYEGLERPALIVTGTRDGSRRTKQPYTWRIEPYELAAPGDKFLIVIEGAAHSLGGISDAATRRRAYEVDPAQLAIVLSSSTAFWDAHLRERDEARAFLRRDALPGVTRFERR